MIKMTPRLLDFLKELKRRSENVKFLNYIPRETFYWSTRDDTSWIEILNAEFKAHRVQGTLFLLNSTFAHVRIARDWL